jgi:hypothetical protein
MKKLTDAIEEHRREPKHPHEQWDEHDYERFLKGCDAGSEKYMELLDKYGASEEAAEKIAKEMGWDHNDNETDDELMSVEEMNAICEAAAKEPPLEPDPHREGIDWIRTEHGDLCHPLQHRCFESAIKFWRQVGELGLAKSADEDLNQFISEFQTTGAKLAGALNPIAHGMAIPDPAFTVAYLKRALDHLHKSQAGLEAVAPKKLLPDVMVVRARKELFDIREGILHLMDQLRGRART